MGCGASAAVTGVEETIAPEFTKKQNEARKANAKSAHPGLANFIYTTSLVGEKSRALAGYVKNFWNDFKDFAEDGTDNPDEPELVEVARKLADATQELDQIEIGFIKAQNEYLLKIQQIQSKYAVFDKLVQDQEVAKKKSSDAREVLEKAKAKDAKAQAGDAEAYTKNKPKLQDAIQQAQASADACQKSEERIAEHVEQDKKTLYEEKKQILRQSLLTLTTARTEHASKKMEVLLKMKEIAAQFATSSKSKSSKPAEEKPAEEKPAEEPAEEKPAEEKPAEEKPAEEKPAEEKPAESDAPAYSEQPKEDPAAANPTPDAEGGSEQQPASPPANAQEEEPI